MEKKPHPKFTRGENFTVYVDGVTSFNDLLESKNFFKVSADIKEEDFRPDQRYKRKIEMSLFRLSNLPSHTLVSTEEVLALIKYYEYRPANLLEGLSQENEKIMECKDSLVMFLGKTIEQNKALYAPGIRFDGDRSMLNLYGTSRHWKENDYFAVVPDKYYALP